MTTKFFLTRVQSTNYEQHPISKEGTFTKELYFKGNVHTFNNHYEWGSVQ